MEVAVLTFGRSRFHVVAAVTVNARSEVLFDVSGFTSNEHLATVADELESKCSTAGRGR